MLRTIFVLGILAFGLRHAVRGPFFAMLLYLWLAYFRPESWLWNPALIMALNLPFFVGIFCLMLTIVSGQLTMNGRIVVLLLLVLQSCLSTLTSPYAGYAWPFTIDFAKAILMTWMIASLSTDATRVRHVIAVICLSLGFESAKQGWAQLVLNPGARNDNPLPSFGDNNLVAVGMFALIGLIIALSRTAPRWWEKWGYRLLAVGIAYRGLSTYSRGGFLCALALGVMFILRSKRRLMPILALATVSFLILPVLPDAFWERIGTVSTSSLTQDMDRFDPTGSDADAASAASRVHFWKVATVMANAHPLAGVGLNAFKAAFDEYDDLGGFYGRGRAVHSMWFGILAELGYPGFVLMVTCIVLAFVAARRARRIPATAPQAAAIREFGVALETSLIVIAVGGSFVNFQYIELFWHLIGLSIAVNTLAVAAARPLPMAPNRPVAAIA